MRDWPRSFGFSSTSTRRVASSARDHRAGFRDQRLDVLEAPDRRRADGLRLVGDDVLEHHPKRRHVELGYLVVIGVAGGFAVALFGLLALAVRLRGEVHCGLHSEPDFVLVHKIVTARQKQGRIDGAFRCAAAHVLLVPPSTANTWPVMKSLSGEHRKISVPSRSSGYSSRLIARRATAPARDAATCTVLVSPVSDSV